MMTSTVPVIEHPHSGVCRGSIEKLCHDSTIHCLVNVLHVLEEISGGEDREFRKKQEVGNRTQAAAKGHYFRSVDCTGKKFFGTVVISMKDPDVNDASAESVYGACEDLHSFNFHIIYGSGVKGAYEYAVLSSSSYPSL